MLEHRNQKGDLPREKSGGFGRGRKFRGSWRCNRPL